MRPPSLGTLRTLELRNLGKTLWHGVLVGIVVGLAALAFFLALEWVEFLCLEHVVGLRSLQPGGEYTVRLPDWPHTHLRLWLLLALPAAGGAIAGLIGYLAPEVLGGGSDAFIAAFHHGGVVRKRVLPLKLLASVATLGTGGSGGREGPTMHIGAAVGALVARVLRVTARERRLMLVSGAAGGIAAIFRTPLGAALLAVEALYRGDFESDALVPAIAASVTSYSIFTAVFPHAGHLFRLAPRYPFDPRHLPLYAAMALALSVFALGFVTMLRASQRRFAALPGPRFLRPALGGLAVGLVAVLWLVAVNPHGHDNGQGTGVLGGGYGAAQVALRGAGWLREGWHAAELLLALALVKMVATSLTIGSGGSAGDLGPSLVIGGLLGGAFGRVAQLLFDHHIDPGAFALVGMGAFYGGLTRAPVSSLVMVCEMAGNYDLLVPLMLAEGITFLMLRGTGLYHAQVATRFDSPVHAGELALDVLKGYRVGDTMPAGRPFVTVPPGALASAIIQILSQAPAAQDAFPVLDATGKLIGLLPADTIRMLLPADHDEALVCAADVMGPPAMVSPADDLHVALERLLEAGLRELPVVDAHGVILGMIDESDITRRYHELVGQAVPHPA